MESSDTVILEPCIDNTSIVIQSVNRIAYTTNNIDDNESNNITNNKYIELTNTCDYNNHRVTLLNTTNMNSMEQSKYCGIFIEYCRICANKSNNLMPIFEGMGIQHNLYSKIHKYLPIQISESDTLPLHICYQCSSTLLAWHDLLEGCLIAEQKLLQIQSEFHYEDKEKYGSTMPENSETGDIMKASEVPQSDVAEIHPLSDVTISEKNNLNEEDKSVNDRRSCNNSTGLKIFIDTQNESININKDISDVTKDKHNRVWKMDSGDVNLNYNDVIESHSIDNDQVSTNVNNTSIKAKCSICTIGFFDIKSLHVHVKTHNLWNSQESYQCVECNKCFKLKDSLVRHLRIHNNERSFTCHVCGKQFRDSGGLSRHLNDVHAKRKPFPCDICNRNFASNATRNDHRRTHTGERPYICNLCGKKFKSKACLYIHSKVHTNDFPHPCLLCNKKFRRRQELLCHMTTHTGEKNFICDVCERRFRIKSELARHTRTHSDEKPFICNKCGMSFRQRRYLNNHIKGRHS